MRLVGGRDYYDNGLAYDDKIKAAKHGMDKWSFRKMPEKK